MADDFQDDPEARPRTSGTVQAFEQAVRQALPVWVPAMVAAWVEVLGRPIAGAAGAAAADAVLRPFAQRHASAWAASLRRALEEQLDAAGSAEAATTGAPGLRASTTSMPMLSLIDDDEIEEDIALAALVQTLESETDGELRQLVALSNGLAGRSALAADVNPLSPARCARAVRESLAPFGLPPAARVRLLQAISPLMGQRMKAVYAQLIDRLRAWRVKPSEVQLRSEVPHPRRTAAPASERQLKALAGGLFTLVAPRDGSDAVADAAATERPTPSTLPIATPQRTPPPIEVSLRSSFQTLAPAETSLARLVAQAQAVYSAALAAEAQAQVRTQAQAPSHDNALELRLFADPLAAAASAGATAAAALPSGVAVRVMTQLMTQLMSHSLATVPDGMPTWLQRLLAPAQALAAQDSGLWRDLEHPWWRWLDRLIAIAEVHEDLAPDDAFGHGPSAVGAALSRAVDRLVARGDRIDRHACEQAVAAAEQAGAQLFEQRQQQVQPALGPLQTAADRQAIADELQRQIVRQLQLSPAPPALRQFFLGAWARAMTHVALHQGSSSQALADLAQCVDDLTQACSTPGRAVSAAQQAVLLRQARAGLAHAPLAQAERETELAALAALLRQPPTALAEAAEGRDPAHHAQPAHNAYNTHAADTRDAPAALDTRPLPDSPSAFSYAGLPTVPVDIVDAADPQAPTRAALDRQAWIESLAAGDYCRLFLKGGWMTAQLNWVSANRRLYVFNSRHRDGTHSMTRPALEKLRSAGLATSILQGHLLARAMDSLLDSGLR